MSVFIRYQRGNCLFFFLFKKFIYSIYFKRHELNLKYVCAKTVSQKRSFNNFLFLLAVNRFKHKLNLNYTYLYWPFKWKIRILNLTFCCNLLVLFKSPMLPLECKTAFENSYIVRKILVFHFIISENFLLNIVKILTFHVKIMHWRDLSFFSDPWNQRNCNSIASAGGTRA